jgi:SAM-dependent methyltransferase
MKRRRSLTHVGGAVDTAGSREIAAKLAEALDVQPAPEPGAVTHQDDPDRAHVHGFHTYPARMHPTTAARLIKAVSEHGESLLDPFCGSGTILVEAMIAGRRPTGTDISPLAVRLARLKTGLLDENERVSLVDSGRHIAAFADARRERRAGATRRYPREDVEVFDPHVLLELDSLRHGIAELGTAANARVRGALELALSAILVKVSRRASDTSGRVTPRRIAVGYPSRLFVRKAEELAGRVAELARHLPEDAALARVEVDDATRLRAVSASSIDAVVTSPPYVGTYDYLTHQALRARWLGLDTKGLAAGELGARRRYAALNPREARAVWTRELGAAFRAIARACRRGARVVMVIADSGVGDQALRADVIISDVGKDAGFIRLASASQVRPHFHGPTARAFQSMQRSEHAIALEKR